MAPPSDSNSISLAEAIVVLGCRVHQSGLQGPLQRRLLRAADVSRSAPALPVIMSGGKTWNNIRECDAMKDWWMANHSPSPQLLLEERSETTRENAIEVAQLCHRLRYRRVVLVTCDFHMPRARGLFQKFGLEVVAAPAVAQRSRAETIRLLFREWGASALDPWAALLQKKEGEHR